MDIYAFDVFPWSGCGGDTLGIIPLSHIGVSACVRMAYPDTWQ